MKPEVKNELHTRWFPVTSDGALRELRRKLEKGSRLLTRKQWDDGGFGECLASLCGRWHPDLQDSEHPGMEFAALLGFDYDTTEHVSLVITEWDTEPSFAKELLAAINVELFKRKEAKRKPLVLESATSRLRPVRRERVCHA